MDQAGGVGGLEAFGHLDREREHFAFRDGAALIDLAFKMAPDDQFHGDVVAVKRPSGGKHPDHMRVAERRGDAGFFLKRGDAAGVGGVVFVENFDRDFAIEGVVMGDENHAHAADRVAAGQ